MIKIMFFFYSRNFAEVNMYAKRTGLSDDYIKKFENDHTSTRNKIFDQVGSKSPNSIVAYCAFHGFNTVLKRHDQYFITCLVPS